MAEQEDQKLREAREKRLDGLYAVMNQYGDKSTEAKDYFVKTVESLSTEEGERFVHAASMALLLRNQTKITEVTVGPEISDKITQ